MVPFPGENATTLGWFCSGRVLHELSGLHLESEPPWEDWRCMRGEDTLLFPGCIDIDIQAMQRTSMPECRQHEGREIWHVGTRIFTPFGAFSADGAEAFAASLPSACHSSWHVLTIDPKQRPRNNNCSRHRMQWPYGYSPNSLPNPLFSLSQVAGLYMCKYDFYVGHTHT